MSNFDLFYDGQQTPDKPQSDEIKDKDLDMVFYPRFYSQKESIQLFDELLKTINWKQEQIKWYGKLLDLPRKTAWYGEKGKNYTYSGISVFPEPWTPALEDIKNKIETVCGIKLNSVLLNLYRDEKDSVSWHSDDEKELGINPVIVSLSLGEERVFQLQNKENPDLRKDLLLTSGSLLLMRGATQHYWKHQIPKTSRKLKPRINLTFRIIK
jgi:alkylated DNA repair dioxygenase AlkB